MVAVLGVRTVEITSYLLPAIYPISDDHQLVLRLSLPSDPVVSTLQPG